MGQDEILELFFNHPAKEFYLRQLARKTKTPKTTASRILGELAKKGIVKKVEREPYTRYKADTESLTYRFEKKQAVIKEIVYSGLLKEIVEGSPRAVILFGSASKAEYDEKSDIDIFVEGEKPETKTRLKKKVNIVSGLLEELPPELRQNIINGTKLYGEIRIEKPGRMQGRTEEDRARQGKS